MAAVLVTLATAKIHLHREDTSAEDTAIQLKLDQSEAIILEYLDTAADPLWVGPSTAPGAVTAAILLMLEHLYANRGIDMAADTELWEAVKRLLARWHVPAVA